MLILHSLHLSGYGNCFCNHILAEMILFFTCIQQVLARAISDLYLLWLVSKWIVSVLPSFVSVNRKQTLVSRTPCAYIWSIFAPFLSLKDLRTRKWLSFPKSQSMKWLLGSFDAKMVWESNGINVLLSHNILWALRSKQVPKINPNYMNKNLINRTTKMKQIKDKSQRVNYFTKITHSAKP